MDTATASPPIRDHLRPLRYLWRVPLLLLHAVLAIMLAAFVMSWNRNRVMRDGREPFSHRLVRWWSVALMRIFGLRAVRVGEPLADPVLFVANHTSWIDIELLHSQRAACFVAKAEIAHWPLVGWLAASGGTIFHRRGSNHSLAAVMQVMVERLRAGRSVAVFPEGGTGPGDKVRTFHARIFQVAADAQVPIQPVALCYGKSGKMDLSVPFGAKESFFANFVRLLGGPGMDAEVHFLEPVAVNDEGRRQIAETARTRIAAALGVE